MVILKIIKEKKINKMDIKSIAHKELRARVK